VKLEENQGSVEIREIKREKNTDDLEE